MNHQGLEQIYSLISRDPHAALAFLRRLKPESSADPALAANWGSLLVETGTALRDRAIVREGIAGIEASLGGLGKEARPYVFYNLGNGYYALDQLCDAQNAPLSNLEDSLPLAARDCYRQAISEDSALPVSEQAKLRINYGNCLARFGRSIEAAAEYGHALTLSPGHPMAAGNLAIELERLAFVSQDWRVLRDALTLLDTALSDQRLDSVGIPGSRKAFDSVRVRAVKTLQTLGHAHPTDSAPLNEQPDTSLGDYQRYCAQHGLFLNLWCEGVSRPNPMTDNVGLRLLVPVREQRTFVRLSRVLNEIKERFAVARYLLHRAQQEHAEDRAVDALTLYTDNLDYSTYGMTTAQIKVAFEGAFSVLDKIALFLNGYLVLGLPARDVDFRALWRKEATRQAIDVRGTHGRPFLLALHDIARELETSLDLGRIPKKRNLSTHRYLVVHSEAWGWRDDADGREYHLGRGELVQDTVGLLKLVKSAVIYLIAFVSLQESEKLSKTSGPVPRIVMRHHPQRPRGRERG